jgi:hypothetical protein
MAHDPHKLTVAKVLWTIVPLAVLAMFIVPALVPNRCSAPRTACQSQLHQIDLSLEAHCYPPVTDYPLDLALLNSNDVSPELFVCPTSGNKPGAMSNVMEWMDYIYVAGLSSDQEYPKNLPILIEPPLHHDKAGGNALMASHATSWFPAPDLDRLIEWTYAYAESNGLRVVVSEALMKRSKGRYKSRP